ncbi:MAG: filamentous hemagglutinin N-terminal domain-containing protein, partial [Cyanobacteria bacterium P01_A01_bin.105]
MAPSKSCAVLIMGGLWVSGSTVWAQSIVPNGAGSVVTPVDGTYGITGGTASEDGANLFHSFEQFGLTAAEAANFITQPNVVNVIGRINGGNPSLINGQLGLTGSEANLFLLNPVGVIFGPDATLALPGDFSVSTADGLTFADDTLEAIGTPDYASLVGNPTGLVFRFSSPGSIINAADLTLDADSALMLTGGTVVSTGTVSAGSVAIAAVPGEQLIRLNPDGSLLSYDIAPSGDGLSPLSLPELLTGAGDIANLELTSDGTVRLVNADVTIPDTPGAAIVNGTLTAGEITLLGDTIGVIDSVLDASGADGGGAVR